MPPILATAPTAKSFTDAWTKKFEEVAKAAAGRDGRLSITEARRIAERTDGGRFFSDNAVKWLQANGQTTVSVTKLVEAARSYAASAAATAAKPDGRISFDDAATKLRRDLRDDFLYLRGKIVDGPQRTHAELVADVKDAMIRAFDNGTAVKLSGPPAAVRGRRLTVDNVSYAPQNLTLRGWVADNRIYVSVAANRPTPLVGWYDLGPVPPVGTRAGD